jgi:hypothetical protein
MPVKIGYEVQNCWQKNLVQILTRRWSPHPRNGGVAGRDRTVKVIREQDILQGDWHGILVINFLIKI